MKHDTWSVVCTKSVVVFILKYVCSSYAYLWKRTFFTWNFENNFLTGSLTFFRKWWKQTCRDVDPISSRSMDNHLFLPGLWNFAEENNIGLQILVWNDQKWSIFIWSFGSTSTIETFWFQVNLIFESTYHSERWTENNSKCFGWTQSDNNRTTIPRCNFKLFYAFKMAVAIAFFRVNAVEAI